MSQPARTISPLPSATPPFFATPEELWRWQLDQLGPPSTWPEEERAELEPLYRALQARLGEAE